MSDDRVLPTALAFAKRGIASLPLHYPVGTDTLVCSCGRLCGRDAAKHPYGKLAPKGPHSATTDTGILKHWFGYVVPEANLGVHCERLVVLDIDPRHDGDQSLAELEHECELPHTWRVITGSGGQHIYFAAPDGISIKNYSYKPDEPPGPLGVGIDIRARGGYVVAPLSRHINGRRYEWSVDHHPADTALAPLPEWLAERLVASRAAHGDDGDGTIAPTPGDVWAARTSQPITEYPEAAALSIAGHFFRHNCDYDLVRGMLHAWNIAWVKPPLDTRELDKLIDRVATYHAERIERELER